MKTSGVLYQHNQVEKTEVEIGKLVKVLKIGARVLSRAGGLMMVLAAIGLLYVYWPLFTAEAGYSWSETAIAQEMKKIRNNITAGKEKPLPVAVIANPPPVRLSFTPTPMVERPGWDIPDPNYSIYIPKIDARSRVIANVDAGNQDEYYKALKLGVAAARGLSYPGQIGTTYLFAHSVGSRVDFARYNAVFYLLDKLSTGDDVEIAYQNVLYKYKVANIEILEANDLRYLIPQSQTEQVILQTCYPPGTTWKRLLVIAKRV